MVANCSRDVLGPILAPFIGRFRCSQIISYRRLLLKRTPNPPSRVSPASRKTTPALSNAAWIAANVLALGSVAPRSRFLIATSEIPDALARSTCRQLMSIRVEIGFANALR